MESFVTGTTIKTLREKKNITQLQLAEIIGVSDKAVSKWETGKGLPDVSLIESLAGALGISVAELFAGEYVVNKNKPANMRRMKFYVCPICGNAIWSTGELVANCCGVKLPPLEVETADDLHGISIERIEDEYFVCMDHEMEKDHFILFIAYVTSDRCSLKKLYPEGNAEGRFLINGHGDIYVYCKKHGLYSTRV